MIGSRLRDARKEKELTLKQLAEQTGFTASYISQIERDLIEPSITALRKFCTVLNMKIYFFLKEDAKDPTIVRRNDRQILKLPNSNVVYEFISPMMRQSPRELKFEALSVTVSPKSWSSDDWYSHNADEIIIVTKGEMLIKYNDKESTLYEGDSIYLSPNTPQRIYNTSEDTLEFLSIITPAIF